MTHSIGTITYLYTCSSVGLFLCLSRMTALIVREVAEDVARSRKCSFYVARYYSALAKWRCIYVLVRRLIHELNRCFGLILLVFISKQFVAIVTVIFEIMLNIQQENFFAFKICLSFGFLLKTLVYFSVVIFACDSINAKVLDTHLRQLALKA